jgi:hypothetical protein
MYCKECGHKIADDSKFCASCGKPQNREVVSNLETSNTDSLQLEDKIADKETEQKNIFSYIEQEKKSSFGRLFGILFVIIAVIVGAIALKGNYTSSEGRNINKGESSNKSFKVARIKYEVTGTASSANITQTNPDGGIEQYSNVKLPGSYAFSVPIRRGSFDYYHASISAQNNGSRGSITVTIYVNGKIFKTSTSSGAYVIASADGAVEYKDVE